MRELIASVREGTLEERILPRQVLRTEYGPDKQFLYGMFFGGGMIYKAIELNHRVFKQDARSQGVLGATTITAGLIGRACLGDRDGILAPNKVQILLDGEPHPQGEFNMIISSTLNRLFAGMRPFWGSGSGGVRLTAVSPEARNIPRAAVGILRGSPNAAVYDDPGFTSVNVKRAEMRFDCGFTVDGELVEPDPGCVVSLTADDTVQFVRA
jgi:diacylglycerol kinase (ATP)